MFVISAEQVGHILVVGACGQCPLLSFGAVGITSVFRLAVEHRARHVRSFIGDKDGFCTHHHSCCNYCMARSDEVVGEVFAGGVRGYTLNYTLAGVGRGRGMGCSTVSTVSIGQAFELQYFDHSGLSECLED